MITDELINPASIVVVGASDNLKSPGGKVLYNLLAHGYKGELLAVNPKKDIVQGIKCFRHVKELPEVQMAVIAIAAPYCLETVEILAREKKTKGFIILSAGFSEESHEGAILEKKIVEVIDENGGSLIGPNCIGLMNCHHTSVFTTPVPRLSPDGVDFISGSGATAVFIMESAIPKGLPFNSVYSVGNSAQIGVEDVLEYLDVTYEEGKSARVKLLYIESIQKPQKLLKHSSSLIRKGCKIAAIKAGCSEEGSRAASSHTGAMATPDTAVDALFQKAGIVRCYGREELVTVASIFQYPELKGRNMAIITHAGGPAVMLTDALSKGKLHIPPLSGPKAQALKEKLFPGSSVGNPIDFLATGTAEQLGIIIDAVNHDFEEIDAMAVIFGSPGLFPVYDVYDVLDEKIKNSPKPIFPILPSIINVAEEIKHFISKGHVAFFDEVTFGNALAKVVNTSGPFDQNKEKVKVNADLIRQLISESSNGYMSPDKVSRLLEGAGIPLVPEKIVNNLEDAVIAGEELGYPVVAKVIGPVHKSDVGGVVTDIKNQDELNQVFQRLIKISGASGILIQPMLEGFELFAGLKKEKQFGHLLMFGLGGIFIEIFKDVKTLLCPASKNEVLHLIDDLKSKKIFEGARGKKGISKEHFADIIVRLSALAEIAPEIEEMDINPFIASEDKIIAVDARIKLNKDL